MGLNTSRQGGHQQTTKTPPSSGDESKYATTWRVRKQLEARIAAQNDQYTKLPFWCGYLPDSDAKELLNYRNDFILRKLEVDDSLCVTVALKKNKVELPLVYSF